MFSKRLMGFLVVLALTLNCLVLDPVNTAASDLTAEQSNAIAMLNHITVLTQEIIASKNSRVYMEEAYSSLLNNTYPNVVDVLTLKQLTGLLDTMENYRMIGAKRDRLQLVYEQSQAQAIRAVVSAVRSFDPSRLVASVAYMAVDSYTSYTEYTADVEQQYLENDWALNEEEANDLHESRKGTFSYMVQMVNDYDLPGDNILTEDTIDEFVKWKNNENIVSRIHFFESNKETYQSYGGYWLALADSYYNNGDYDKCLEAVEEYENLNTRIFRRDYELANVLPLAIAAAKEVYDIRNYASYAAEKVQLIIDNTDHDDWALRYFAAQTLIDLYAQTQKNKYLQDAYETVLDNVNYLVGEQRTMNTAYLAPVQTENVPKDASREEKKQIEEYNDMIKETRKVEMPPIYEPLRLNCDLLFAIADETDLPETDKTKIDKMLHPNDEPLFLTMGIDEAYWFNNPYEKPVESADIACEFGGNVLILPTYLLTKDALVTVLVTEPDIEAPIVFRDWTIDKTVRGTEGDLTTFETALVSAEAHKYTWKPDTTVLINVTAKDGLDISYSFAFETVGTKNEWYDYLKVWEGHKNNWYDYVKVWENSVTFERVNAVSMGFGAIPIPAPDRFWYKHWCRPQLQRY